jgi:hypothetical protein
MKAIRSEENQEKIWLTVRLTSWCLVVVQFALVMKIASGDEDHIG